MLHNILIINNKKSYPHTYAHSYPQECNFYTALGCKNYIRTNVNFCKRMRMRVRACMRWPVSTDIICNHFLDVLVLKKSNGLLETDRRCCLA